MVDAEDEQLRWLLDKQLNWIGTADSKLALLVPIPLAMLAISLAEFGKKLKFLTAEDVPLLLSTGLLIGSLLFSLAVVISRTSGPAFSNIFFGTISKRTPAEFQSDILSMSADEFRKDLIAQIHINSKIASIKHQNISRASFALALAVPVWLATLVRM